jgi:alpha-ketoglutarate-dependent 2,4-dichlorophenoxyacetate dioxygenase
MAISIRQLHPLYVGEVSGVDTAKPLDPMTVAQLNEAINKYAVLIFHEQVLNDDKQIAFAANFGGLSPPRYNYGKQRIDTRLADISNLDSEGKLRDKNHHRRLDSFGNMLWHTDASFRRVPGALSMLYAHKCPAQGGETEFTDLRAAWDALPPMRQHAIENLVAEHSIWHSRALVGFYDFTAEQRAEVPPVPQRLVRTHPGSKRRTLYLASHASHIIGWPIPESRILLNDLIEHATRRKFVYQHHWKAGDLVIWDNRCTMHRGRMYDMEHTIRDLRRVTTQDVASTLEMEPIAA